MNFALRKFLFVLCFYTFQTPVLGQENEPLNGEWVVNIDRTIESIRSEYRAQFDSLPDVRRTLIVQSFASRRFEFLQSGRVNVHWVTGQTKKEMTGSWVKDDDQLEILDELGKRHLYQVSFLDPNTVVLTLKSNTGLITKLCLNKIP